MVGVLKQLNNNLITMNTIKKLYANILKNETLLAIDPGLLAVGVAVFQNCKLKAVCSIRAKKQKNQEDTRLWVITKSIQNLLQKYNPTILAIENQYLAIRSNSIIKVIEVKGIIKGLYISQCLDRKIIPKILEINPIEAKRAIGVIKKLKRKESKEAVSKKIVQLYPKLINSNQDIKDAVAIGIAGWNKLIINS